VPDSAALPVLVTLHLPPGWYPAEVFESLRPDVHLCCVSDAQRRRCPDGARIFATVPNGVAVERFDARREKDRYVVALGRICPEKGFHLALDAARRAAVPLVLAGEVFRYAAHETYFEEMIVPRLDAARSFVGRVGFERKRALLARARCLLVPSLVAETSCLVAMEAMASGTPVVAFRSGALVDLVEHGRTGFLVDGVDEMADAIAAAGMVDPRECRRVADARFSAEAMTRRYIDIYDELAGRRGPGLQKTAAADATISPR
jgi:glycosyltransferase involved in cell wall biosynthesis